MSEEQQDTTGQSSKPDQPEQQANGEVPKPDTLPENQEWDHVEFDAKTQRRFNRVYAEMKGTKDLVRQMGQTNRQLIEKLEEMEAQQAKKGADDRVADLIQQEKAALEEQDYAKASQVRDQITDIKIEAKTEKPAKKEPEPEQSYGDWLTPEKAKALNDFANAKDDKGQLLHPWADADHPEYETAINAAQVVIQRNPDAPIEEILEKIAKVNDRVIAPRRSTPAVLGSGGDAPRPKKKTAISEDEKKIAAAMYPDLSGKDAAERYAKSKERLGL